MSKPSESHVSTEALFKRRDNNDKFQGKVQGKGQGNVQELGLDRVQGVGMANGKGHRGDEQREGHRQATASCIAFSEAGDRAKSRSTPRSMPRSTHGSAHGSTSGEESDNSGSGSGSESLTRVTSRSSWTPALGVPPARLREIERENRALLARIDAARSGRRAQPITVHDPRLSSAAINRRRHEARIAEENQRIMRRLQRVKSCTDTSSPWVFSQRKPLY